MDERRDGAADRRASKRGGRRAGDTMRSDLDVLRLKWDELDIDARAGVVARGEFESDDAAADRAAPGRERRSQAPRRK
jgi:hypothetical protein